MMNNYHKECLKHADPEKEIRFYQLSLLHTQIYHFMSKLLTHNCAEACSEIKRLCSRSFNIPFKDETLVSRRLFRCFKSFIFFVKVSFWKRITLKQFRRLVGLSNAGVFISPRKRGLNLLLVTGFNDCIVGVGPGIEFLQKLKLIQL